ncbi:glycoside hydrolase family 99-like domain-containing protein [Bifidobacterium olomucense]|uniref:Glycosyl transferase n=1 Tax=Bifidobacterium olomucense TaxID=2675324 RepID=A0A7Y0EZR9_9BIFI|nr:glycoside hydrolase family 99-like domain-containing protein [Bifidobacterium sp. DSM 109959]NMM99396.1 glycosyl transferase [Bifidobacterium sp. DSM 109959]
MKALAIYLPAFHRIPENDEWWGKGFTEWDNVRSGQKYFKGHVQPVSPINNYYYNLSRPEDIRKQISLANRYNVSGFIFYHYWFSKNRQIFETPAELLRDQIKDKIEYCFCWANETWITTWHGKDPDVLIEQTYGPEDEWLAHIRYLETFFKDSRYIKISGRPLFFIYRPNSIPRYEDMIKYWNQYLKSRGLQPLYIVEYISSKNHDVAHSSSDAVMEFEPLYTTFFDLSLFNKAKRALCKILHRIDYQSYDNLWKKILRRNRTYSGKDIFKSCFVAWDNSPRKEHNSMIVKGATPEKFGKYLHLLINQVRKDTRNDYLIINAWNEWSEGAFLEPSEEYQYRYLKALNDNIKDSEV